MANFSSFFPVASGGGGFTKIKKYSTFASSGETTDAEQVMAPGLTAAEVAAAGQPNVRVSAISNGGTTASLSYWRIGGSFWTGYADQTLPQDFFVGARFNLPKTTGGTETITVTASTAGFISNNNAANTTITFAAFDSGGSAGFDVTSVQYNILPPLLKFNPATNGLSDGDSIGYLLAGGNATGVLRGTAIISNAATDLIITPGVSSGTASTITGGLTLTSADGNVDGSFAGRSYLGTAGSAVYGYESNGGMGINGFGVGNQMATTSFVNGNGAYGKDGCVLIYY